MEIVEYERSLQWVGHLTCPHCQQLSEGWRSSGMSECFPHFYCSQCSNALQREQDKELVYYKATPQLLAQIAATLPACVCGGQFTPTAGPKCRWCHQEIPLVSDPVKHLHNPNVVLLDGACLCNAEGPRYQVRIID